MSEKIVYERKPLSKRTRYKVIKAPEHEDCYRAAIVTEQKEMYGEIIYKI